MQPNNMVHINTFDPTHWPRQSNIMALILWLHNSVDVICHATQQHGTYDPVPWNHIAIQALIGDVTCVCLCKCTNMYVNHQIVKTSNSHKHTFLYSHNIPIIILYFKTSQKQ